MIHVVLATDDNFVQHCCVTIASILANNEEVTFYVFTEGLNSENELLLKELAHKNGQKLHICLIEGETVSLFPMPSYMSSHISIATYYRLFVENVLPKSIDRVLYLDCDIVVRGSLLPLWELSMEDKAVGAVYQYNEWAERNNSYDRLGYEEQYGYFNAGVLLINLSYWRANGITEKLMSFIKENYSQIHSHDQDVLNAVLHKEVLPLDYIWNFLPSFFEKEKYTFPSFVNYEGPVKSPIIIHYVYKPKPWQYVCDHPYKNEYYKYLDETAFKGWRPTWNWKEYNQFIIKPRVNRFLLKLDCLNFRRVLKIFKR